MEECFTWTKSFANTCEFRWKTVMQLQPVRLYLVSTPGVVRDATGAILSQMRQLKLIATASGVLSAVRMLKTRRPELVLLDANLSNEEMIALLQWRMENCPNLACIVATTSSNKSARLWPSVRMLLFAAMNCPERSFYFSKTGRRHTAAPSPNRRPNT